MSERDWLSVESPHVGPTHLYLIQVITYGVSHPIKVGIAKDIGKRLIGLHAMGINCPVVLGYYHFTDGRYARKVETMTRKAFPRCPRYGDVSREILAASKDDLIAFITPLATSKFVDVESAA